MKKTTLGIVALLTVATLAGCNKTPVENPNENAEIANPASVYCEENDGTLNLEEGLCVFADGSYCEEWAYYNNECQPGDSVEDENIDTVLPEGAKTSLTNEELEEIIDTHFPKGYTYSVYNEDTKESLTGEYTYPEDLDHSLLLPIHATMASREVIASGIEDGMIYTNSKVTLQNGVEVNILYIVNPETLDFVAANVENGHEITNYQFVY